MKVILTSGQLAQVLNIDRDRLRTWNEQGIFGEKMTIVGRGIRRQYDFCDVLIARITRELMDITKSRILLSIRINKDIIRRLYSIIMEWWERPKNSEIWLIATQFENEGWKYNLYIGDMWQPIVMKKGQGAIIVPIHDMIDEVLGYFNAA